MEGSALSGARLAGSLRFLAEPAETPTGFSRRISECLKQSNEAVQRDADGGLWPSIQVATRTGHRDLIVFVPGLVATRPERRDEIPERQCTASAQELGDQLDEAGHCLGAIDGEELPIRNYDSLAAKPTIERIERLRDIDDLRTVLAYEAANKARKGVTTALEGRLEHLVAELAAAS